MISSGMEKRIVQQANGNHPRTWDAGGQSVSPWQRSQQTSVVSVITCPNGEFVTAFAGRASEVVMSLDFAALGQSGAPEKTVSLCVDLHHELVAMAVARGLERFEDFSDHYEDAGIAV